MGTRSDKVVGYYAFQRGTMNVVCDGGACVIAGTERLLRSYISNLGNCRPSECVYKETTYAEVVQGMSRGGVYAFDQGAGARFVAIAKKEGINLVEFKIANDPKPCGNAVRLMRIKWQDMV